MARLVVEHEGSGGKSYSESPRHDAMLKAGEITKRLQPNGVDAYDAVSAGMFALESFAEGRPKRFESAIYQIVAELRKAYERGYSDRVSEEIDDTLAANEARAKRREAASVYFIQSGNGPIKIGIAVDVEKRRRSLQTAHPSTLTTLAITTGGAEMEREFHERFAEHRQEGEWFDPHPDILAEIERLNAPTPTD